MADLEKLFAGLALSKRAVVTDEELPLRISTSLHDSRALRDVQRVIDDRQGSPIFSPFTLESANRAGRPMRDTTTPNENAPVAIVTARARGGEELARLEMIYSGDSEIAVREAGVTSAGVRVSEELVVVFDSWLVALATRIQHGAGGTEVLRQQIESLIRAVRLEILENDRLLEQIEERDQIIAQFEGQVATLEAELRRSQLDKRRVSGPIRTIGALVATTVVSFAGGVGSQIAASDPPVVAQFEGRGRGRWSGGNGRSAAEGQPPARHSSSGSAGSCSNS